jgi:hypothetical protein
MEGSESEDDCPPSPSGTNQTEDYGPAVFQLLPNSYYEQSGHTLWCTAQCNGSSPAKPTWPETKGCVLWLCWAQRCNLASPCLHPERHVGVTDLLVASIQHYVCAPRVLDAVLFNPRLQASSGGLPLLPPPRASGRLSNASGLRASGEYTHHCRDWSRCRTVGFIVACGSSSFCAPAASPSSSTDAFMTAFIAHSNRVALCSHAGGHQDVQIATAARKNPTDLPTNHAAEALSGQRALQQASGGCQQASAGGSVELFLETLACSFLARPVQQPPKL